MDNYPSCLVHLQYSYLADPRGVNPAKSRKEDVLTGVLFDFPRIQRRRIVGIRTSQDSLDDPKMTNICGIEDFQASKRKCSFHNVFVELDAVAQASASRSAEQLCDLIWVDVFAEECPGQHDNHDRFIAAAALPFPDYRKWTLMNGGLTIKEECVVLGSCGKDGVSKVIRGTNIQSYRQGVIVQLPIACDDNVRFESSPVFDNSGGLMALGMFTVKLNNGATGLVAMSLDHLAATYGHMIESRV